MPLVVKAELFAAGSTTTGPSTKRLRRSPQRTNEFGVRMALGAQRGHVIRMVFATTLRSVGCGIGIGLALTFGLNPFLATWAKDSSRDPYILLLGTLLLGLVSAIASALPAWNASRLDPMTALRSD